VVNIPQRVINTEPLRLVFANGTVYDFPYPCATNGENTLSMRGKTEDPAYSHGGNEVGDYKAKVKTLGLTFHIRAENRDEYDNALAEVMAVFTRENYKIYTGRIDSHYRISRLSGVKDKWISSFKGRFAEIEVTLRRADPFRYSDFPVVREITVEEQTGAEGLPIRIANLGNVDVPLIISFQPVTVMSEITLTSAERGESFSLNDTMLTSENWLTVNAENGTVYRDNSNAINTFNGTFMSLDPGQNTLIYKGAPGRIKIEYTPRWW